MRTVNARLLVRHNTNEDYHEWWMPGQQQKLYLDRIGRHNNGGTTGWFTIRCNNFSCPAEGIVSERAVMRFLAHTLPVPLIDAVIIELPPHADEWADA